MRKDSPLDEVFGRDVDRLRSGRLSDEETIALAAEVLRSGRIQASSQDFFELLAERLGAVKVKGTSHE